MGVSVWVRLKQEIPPTVLGILCLISASPLGAQTTCPPGSARPKPAPGRPNESGPLVAEVVLKGIVKSRGEFSAVLEDCRFNTTVVAKTGQLLVDGRVTAIDAEGITFLVTGESGTPLPKPLTKRLTLKGKKDY